MVVGDAVLNEPPKIDPNVTAVEDVGTVVTAGWLKIGVWNKSVGFAEVVVATGVVAGDDVVEIALANTF